LIYKAIRPSLLLIDLVCRWQWNIKWSMRMSAIGIILGRRIFWVSFIIINSQSKGIHRVDPEAINFLVCGRSCLSLVFFFLYIHAKSLV